MSETSNNIETSTKTPNSKLTNQEFNTIQGGA